MTALPWSEIAFDFLVAFARANKSFISEQVADAAQADKLPRPKNPRAWGQVYRRALKEGVIRRGGVGRSVRRHAALCPRWSSNLAE